MNSHIRPTARKLAHPYRSFARRTRSSMPRIIASALCLLALWLMGSPLTSAESASPPSAPSSPASLQAVCLNSGKAQLAYHAKTGLVRFVGTEPGQRIARPASLSGAASAEDGARGYLSACGALFGLKDQAAELSVMRQKPLDDGRAVVRFQQVYQGVPVMGGELIAQLDRDLNVITVNGQILPNVSVAVAPAVGAADAQQKALQAIAKQYRLDASVLTATAPELWIYSPLIVGGRGLPQTTLVWRMEVSPVEPHPIRELALVDARNGIVALHFNEVDTAKFRKIYDNNNNSACGLPGCTLVRSEGQAASGIADVDNAYLYGGATYDFYFNNFGRDSIDGAGMQLISTTRYCAPASPCPYQNAFWTGSQMVYGQGFASADDVVAHEMTHGVTQNESHLFYYYQSGAINEALSDIFGEYMDLTDGLGTDTAGVRWLLGEDLSIGAIRNMKNPPDYGDPDKMSSGNYTCDLSELDNGGVHTNSGVANKAAYLIADGDTFNGQTVTGLGITKAAKIFYEAQTNLLTSASDYQDLFNALQQACLNLIGTAGITAGDCDQVRKAVTATEMNQQPGGCAAPPAPICPPGTAALYRFYDDLENTASGRWTTSATSGSNKWFYPQNPNGLIDATYATSGQYNFWGYDQAAAADYNIRMTSDVALPATGQHYLHFSHAFGFEDDLSGAYDGGVVEYSTNGGGSWNDSGALFANNGYNGTMFSGSGNPLGGRSGFVRESNGYYSSRVNLSSLAGQNVRFRFRIGADSNGDDYGWFIDDIHIYTCVTNIVFLPIIRR